MVVYAHIVIAMALRWNDPWPKQSVSPQNGSALVALPPAAQLCSQSRAYAASHR